MICSFCKTEVKINITPIVQSNGRKQLSRRCTDCNTWFGFERQDIESKEFKMPFGKFKDKTLSWIYSNDLNYFTWALKNMTGSLKVRLTEVAEENKPA